MGELPIPSSAYVQNTADHAREDVKSLESRIELLERKVATIEEYALNLGDIISDHYRKYINES